MDRSQVECWMTECYTNGCQVINITAMAIYVIIIQGTSTRGDITHVKKGHQIQKMQRESSLPEISDAEAWVYAGQQ